MRRILPALVIVGTVIVVFVWANPFGPPPAPNTPVIIKTDTTPIKTRPKDPGGMHIPFQDMLVYGLIK